MERYKKETAKRSGWGTLDPAAQQIGRRWPDYSASTGGRILAAKTTRSPAFV